jgi:hypothetical protein
LFSDRRLDDMLRARAEKMLEAIDQIDADRLLNTSVDDWCDYFAQEYAVSAPRLGENEITTGQTETDVDVSGDPFRDIRNRGKPFYMKGTAITFHVPFDGDGGLFRCRPSSFTTIVPTADITQNEVVLTYVRTDHDAEAVKLEFSRDLSEIRRYLEWIGKDVAQFNSTLRSAAKGRLEWRREKILKDRGMVANLGFPLRRRDDAPRTYSVPNVRRKIRAPQPRAGETPFVPEPALDMQEYEHILSVISNMVAVMERSPGAFRNMKEEDLRQHFLVQLNGQYEGQATGETFNFDGKTDILIRDKGKNIFVAECMFWDGPKSLSDKIDQLLGYACWRDTKTAIIVFNRRKDFSAVLTKIPQVIRGHPNFKRDVQFNSESGFRFVFHHKDDPQRELTLTVLAFEVPE